MTKRLFDEEIVEAGMRRPATIGPVRRPPSGGGRDVRRGRREKIADNRYDVHMGVIHAAADLASWRAGTMLEHADLSIRRLDLMAHVGSERLEFRRQAWGHLPCGDAVLDGND
jgi:hypothetical protein